MQRLLAWSAWGGAAALTEWAECPQEHGALVERILADIKSVERRAPPNRARYNAAPTWRDVLQSAALCCNPTRFRSIASVTTSCRDSQASAGCCERSSHCVKLRPRLGSRGTALCGVEPSLVRCHALFLGAHEAIEFGMADVALGIVARKEPLESAFTPHGTARRIVPKPCPPLRAVRCAGRTALHGLGLSLLRSGAACDAGEARACATERRPCAADDRRPAHRTAPRPCGG